MALTTNVTIKDRFGEIDWSRLEPGTVISVPWRAEPYRERFAVPCRGVTVRGVRGPNGQRPVITGEGATTHPQFAIAFQTMETYSLIGVYPTLASGQLTPSDIAFEDLEVRGATRDRADRSFFGANGQKYDWDIAATGFYLHQFARLKLLRCLVTDCGNGIFTSDTKPCSDLTIQECEVYGNGAIGSDRQHNAYCQGIRNSYYSNRFGRPRGGSLAINIKDRGCDVIIQGNVIEGGTRLIDLGTWQGDKEQVAARTSAPNAGHVTIRANTLIARTGDATSLIYYEGGRGDAVVELENNGVYLRKDREKSWWTALLRNEYSAPLKFSNTGMTVDSAPASEKGTPQELRGFDGATFGPVVIPLPGVVIPPVPPVPPEPVWVEVGRQRVEVGDSATVVVLYQRKAVQ